MTNSIRIALDAMGGDHGPSIVVSGAAIASARHPDLNFLLFGDETAIAPLLANEPSLAGRCEIRHTSVTVAMSDKPSQALRRGKGKSSMWQAIQAVRDGQADACVSAGNTGALMTMARFCLRPMEKVERPALAVLWPTRRGTSIVLDAGANIGADSMQLVTFAVMGAAMARIIFERDMPSVGLLSIDAAELFGAEAVEEAARLLSGTEVKGFVFNGFVTGEDLGAGSVDVFVTEGFTGNIALKTAEGTARQVAQLIRSAMGQSVLAKLGYFFSKKAFSTVRTKIDPNNANGAVFLGLDGIVIKSHGDTTAAGFSKALDLGYEMIRHDVMSRIRNDSIIEHNGRAADQSIIQGKSF